ncbi:MAG TPA: anti-sigma factor [Chitinophagales bacterium]|nr:anti-sigma factor [Chitinophagales bacterium]
MNTKEYIESGVLDLYVSGLLSIEEMRDVELKACQNADIKTELVSLQSAMERFAFKYAVAPRPEVKEKVMKAIQAKNEATKIVSLPGKTPEKQPAESALKVKALAAPKPVLLQLLIAASIVLLAIMSGVAFYFNNQFNQAQQQVAQLEEQQSGISRQVDNLQAALNQNAEKVQLLTDANTIRVTMKGTDKSPASIALIYWNTESKVVYLDVKALPPAAADKQYQLWFIDPKAGPVSAGVFDVKTGEIMKMVNAPAAAAFAVTLEPRGGSVNPTMDQMYVVGTVNS